MQDPAAAVAAEQAFTAAPQYAYALLEALSDHQLTTTELDALRALQQETGCTSEQVRVVHGCVYLATLSAALGGGLAERERERLRWMQSALGLLGWAPGE